MCKEDGKLTTTAEFMDLCERITNSQYKFCRGIDPEATYFSHIKRMCVVQMLPSRELIPLTACSGISLLDV